MLTIGGIQAKLGVDVGGYASGILKAEGITQVFGQTFGTFITNPLLGSVQLFKQVGGAAISASLNILKEAEAIQRLRQQTGLTDETIKALIVNNDRAGLSAEQTSAALRFMTLRLGDVAANGAKLPPILAGITDELFALSEPDDQLRLLLDTIASFETAAERARAASAVFGEEAGAKFANAVGGGSAALATLTDEMVRNGNVASAIENDTLAALNTTLGTIILNIEGVRNAILTALLVEFGDQAKLTDGKITDMSESIISQAVPAARELGEQLGRIVNNLDDMIERISLLNPIKLAQEINGVLVTLGEVERMNADANQRFTELKNIHDTGYPIRPATNASELTSLYGGR